MDEVVIFCESYPHIKNTLYLATQNLHHRPVTVVIAGRNDLLSFFRAINEKVFHNAINLMYFETYQGRLAKAINKVVKALYLLPEIVGEKRYLRGIYNKYFAELKGGEMYFFSRYFNPSTYYLLKKLSKENGLVYMLDPSYDVLFMQKVAPSNITELVNLIRCKLVYGHDIVMGKHPLGVKVTCMPDKFIKEYVDKVINREERDSMLKDFDLSRFKVFGDESYSVIFFQEDMVEHDYIFDPAVYEKVLIEVFNVLNKHFPESKVAYKCHPGSGDCNNITYFGKVLPDFIPAEFLFSENVKMYLGFSTMALANVEKGLAVSLIDLVRFRNDIIREQLKKMLIQWSRSKILFPQSLDEFERIVIGINEHRM